MHHLGVHEIDGAVAAFFHGHPLGEACFLRVSRTCDAMGTYEVRVTKTQVAFRRRRSFAFLWLPGTWLEHPDAEVVLSLALPQERHSERFKEVVHPSKGIWMHHLEITSPEDIDAQVVAWIEEAWESAA